MSSTRVQRLLPTSNQPWFRFQNRVSPDSDTTCIYIMDDIGYYYVTSQDFVRQLNNVVTPKIDLHINTMGGDVFEGVAIFNALRNHTARVRVIVDGMAASIGAVIAMAGDEIVMNTGSMMVVHEGHTYASGTASALRDIANTVEMVTLNIAEIFALRAGGDAKKWLEFMTATEKNLGTMFTAEQAVEVGLADSVADFGGSSEGATTDKLTTGGASSEDSITDDAPTSSGNLQPSVNVTRNEKWYTEVNLNDFADLASRHNGSSGVGTDTTAATLTESRVSAEHMQNILFGFRKRFPPT